MPPVMSRQGFLLCFVVTVGLFMTKLPGSSAGACGCPPLWTAFHGMCYRYFSAVRVTWEEAERQCQSFTKPCWDEGATTGQLGHLVSIHSQEEMDFLITLFDSIRNKRASGNQLAWIGLNDKTTEGSFVWSDGSEVNYTFWYPNEPNNQGGVQHCANFCSHFDYKWDDLQCDLSGVGDNWSVGGFICKLGEWL
ncbi:echinoidin-like [Diadema antillarum]|uniref:echinoidin-like n=1 Tax=Diadema antillarum TaxID=105358 RepID=UPI003A8AC213